MILPHPALSAAQAEHLCHRHGFKIAQDGRGHLYLSTESSATQDEKMRANGTTPVPALAARHSESIAPSALPDPRKILPLPAGTGGDDGPLEAA